MSRQCHQLPTFLHRRQRRVRAHAPVGEACAEVQGFADRPGIGDLWRIVGRLDRVRVGPLGHRDLRRGGVAAVAGRELAVGERIDARQVPPVLQLQHEGRLLLDEAPFGVDFGEGRLNGGDVSAVSVEEIDRLLAFRKQNKFVNSAEEFQQVTKVSDSLLKAISPYFKFPEWVKNKKSYTNSFEKKDFTKSEKKISIDINTASQQDLIKVYGIGEGLSKRILEQKEKLGAFVSMEQMNDIWGLSPEVIENLNKSFHVSSTNSIKKININSASIKELSQFPFFKYNLAKEIVTYRTMNGDIKIEDLTKIKGFPVEKLKIIALYLEF